MKNVRDPLAQLQKSRLCGSARDVALLNDAKNMAQIHNANSGSTRRGFQSSNGSIPFDRRNEQKEGSDPTKDRYTGCGVLRHKGVAASAASVLSDHRMSGTF